MNAKIEFGDIIVSLPVKYLMQQTCRTSKFDYVPCGMVDIDALIEANRTAEVSWFRVGDELTITVPTELIKWED